MFVWNNVSNDDNTKILQVLTRLDVKFYGLKLYMQRIFYESHVFFRNSRVRTHCFLTNSWNSSGATGRPEARSSSPSTNRT